MLVYRTLLVLSLLLSTFGTSQLMGQEKLSLQEYLAFVKQHHPFVKQANIQLSESEAKLLKARGAFDPKLKVELNEKTQKGNPYYERFKATFSIPTKAGISLTAEMSQADGLFLNPENTVAGEQLYAVGADIDLGKGLISNPRTIALKQARRYLQQAEEENRLLLNEILEKASHAFLDWFTAYQQKELLDEFVTNAAFRLKGVKRQVAAGDLAPIDSIEARIAYNSRVLMLEKSTLTLNKRKLMAANYLWLNDQPLTFNDELVPLIDKDLFLLNFKIENSSIANHPKVKALEYKIDQQLFEQRLQRSNLLPEIKLGYRWLSSAQNPIQQLKAGLDPENNTTSLKINYPLFLRKERANVKIASLKVEDLILEQDQLRLRLENKISSFKFQLKSLKDQNRLAQLMLEDAKTLFDGEQKKFLAGESSLFLVNSREVKFLEATQKIIQLQQEEQKSQLSFYYLLSF